MLNNTVNYEFNRNEIFNNNFAFAGLSGNFPAGWQKSKGGKTCTIDWVGDNNVRIKNKAHSLASIAQQPKYKIPVYRDQVWSVGTSFRVEKKLNAVLIVHFINSSSRILQAALEFSIEPETSYYEGIVYIPSGASFCYLEIGLKEPGTIWIEDVVFSRIFPISEFDTDARGRLNINSVESVKNVLEPVVVKGKITAISHTVDLLENVTVGSGAAYSSVQDVLLLSTYSFCVLNRGSERVMVNLQLSPDGENWIEENVSDNYLEAYKMRILVSTFFVRYQRLEFIASDGPSQVKVFFQGKG